MQNKFSVAIKIIGVIAILAGVITFFIFASHDYLLQGAIYLVSCIAGGLLIAGFGEIISLLQANYDTLSKIYSDKKIYINKNSESKEDRKPKKEEAYLWTCPRCGKVNQSTSDVDVCSCGYSPMD